MSAFDIYYVGAVPISHAKFRVAGVLTDPDAVTCKVTPPTSPAFTWTYGVDAQLVRDAQGEFHASIDATEAGYWYVLWTGTGAAKGAMQAVFYVRAPQ